jgi:gamma-glutamyltranspeptidase/glutathione hydrolase
MALKLFDELERANKIPLLASLKHNSADYIHALIEVFRISFADASWWIGDPTYSDNLDLLSDSYIAERVGLFNLTRASGIITYGSPP